MITLNADSLLSLWEKGADLTPLRRSLLLLSSAWPEKSYEQWLQTSIGLRDEALLSLRESLFGRKLEATAQCSVCQESLELVFETVQIRATSETASQEGQVEEEGYVVRFRLPTSADLIAVTESETSPADAQLLQRCILSAQHAEQTIDAQQLPPNLIQRVQQDMVRLDPQAETLIALSCPQCQHSWQLSFDIATYLWEEISDWARLILKEVHTLARAYGWSERDILGMNAQRRHHYLELLQAQRK